MITKFPSPTVGAPFGTGLGISTPRPSTEGPLSPPSGSALCATSEGTISGTSSFALGGRAAAPGREIAAPRNTSLLPKDPPENPTKDSPKDSPKKLSTYDAIREILAARNEIGGLKANTIMRDTCRRIGNESNYLMPRHVAKFIPFLEKRLNLYMDRDAVVDVVRKIGELAPNKGISSGAEYSNFRITIDTETALKAARSAAARMAEGLGFVSYDVNDLATIVSELARNILNYAGGNGTIALTKVEGGIQVVARDDGPGIPNIDEILSGNYTSKTGLGRGILGTRDVMTEFEILTAPGMGTTITAKMLLNERGRAKKPDRRRSLPASVSTRRR